MSKFIGFSAEDDCKTIELQGIDSQATLQITRQQDGDLTFAFISPDNDQEDFYISVGEVADIALEFIGLRNQAEWGEP